MNPVTALGQVARAWSSPDDLARALARLAPAGRLSVGAETVVSWGTPTGGGVEVSIPSGQGRLYLEADRQTAEAVAGVLAPVLECWRARQELEAARAGRLATLAQLALSLGHELRGPLANLRMALHLLREAEPEDRLRLLDRLEQEILWCNALIADLVSLARGAEPLPCTTRLVSLVQEALTRLQAPAEVEIELEVDEALQVHVDPDQMVRVLLALLRNAVEAVEASGRVRLTAQPREKVVEVRVEDTGPGVPEALRQRIFEPFFTTRRRRPGLGLALCQQVVRAHGGEVQVEASPDLGGACFRLILPAGPEPGP
ncbi:MAG TPA: ATP-binding protein [Candidatus Nitrosotenuis sp.]|nr:ATP-binding protein [Candidatus Nitrosotenuis sp.]